MTTVIAPSRLHFGLLHLPREEMVRWPGIGEEPGLPVRQFGGVGLMIDQPTVKIAVSPDQNWSATGPLSHRALEFAQRFTASLGLSNPFAFRIEVVACPDEHTGLGVGTALALTVSKAIAIELGHTDWDSAELAHRVGRGERSAIGVHGFQAGGLIVEAGKLPGEHISPLIGRYDLPQAWRVILARPEGVETWSGTREREGFRELKSGTDRATESLCRIVLTGLIPAISASRFDLFSESLYEFNRRVGETFREVQGGIYSSPRIEGLVNELRRHGIHGVGQSSWGPTVFAMIENELEAERIRSRFGGTNRIWIGKPSGGARQISG